MENVYKIKVRSSPNPLETYPSERRYSSSTVLGLSVTFLVLATTSVLMGTLAVRRISTTSNDTHIESNATSVSDETSNSRLQKKVAQDLEWLQTNSHTMNMPAIVCAGSFVMAFGQFLAGFAGLLAWKQWYIDNNITWFFLSSCFATVSSAISFLLITLCLMEMKGMLSDAAQVPPITLGVTANVFITSLLGMIWAFIASNVAYKGMKNDYPEDLVIPVKGKVQVNTVKKGNKIGKVVPPDILDHFPTSGKLAKFYPKKETSTGLPKAESTKEYEERVKKFLDGEDNK